MKEKDLTQELDSLVRNLHEPNPSSHCALASYNNSSLLYALTKIHNFLCQAFPSTKQNTCSKRVL